MSGAHDPLLSVQRRNAMAGQREDRKVRDEDAKRVRQVASRAGKDLDHAVADLQHALDEFNDGMDILRRTAKKLCETDPRLRTHYRDLEASVAAARKHVTGASRALEALRSAVP